MNFLNKLNIVKMISFYLIMTNLLTSNDLKQPQMTSIDPRMTQI